MLAVHARAYSALSTDYQPWPRPPHNIRAVRELTTLAAQTGVRLQVSHVGLAGRRSWRLVDAVLEEVEDGKRAGGDIGFDVVPYPLGVGPMQMLFPPSSVQELQQGRLRRRTRSRLRLMPPSSHTSWVSGSARSSSSGRGITERLSSRVWTSPRSGGSSGSHPSTLRSPLPYRVGSVPQ